MALIPHSLTDSQIIDLYDNGRLPMTNPETLLGNKPLAEIDLRHAYDIQTEYSTSAPRALAWSAIDLNTYDGASEGGLSSLIGRGPTPQAARFDLLEQIADERAKG